jgi:spore germination protein YaaH
VNKSKKMKNKIIIKFLLLIVLLTVPLFLMSGSSRAESDIRFGFWHGNTLASNYQPDWTNLTHVAYAFWYVDDNGTIKPPNNISNYAAVRDTAHQHGVKMIISINTHGGTEMIDDIIANHKNEFADNVLNLLQTQEADGVNIDFEYPSNINTATNTPNALLFESFMSTLYTKLKAANPAYHISFDTTWNNEEIDSYRNANLKNYFDSVFMMDYGWSTWTNVTEPNSPYDSPTLYDTIDSVNDLLKYFDKSQIIVGLPFYGYDYVAASDRKGAKVISRTDIDMKDAVSASLIYGRIWDADSNTPWYCYKSNGLWHQVWYDDSASIGLKYQYVQSTKLGGIGFWALGTEDPSVWNIFFRF